MSASERFKLILGNMKQDDICNFIWIYDQYVQSLEDGEYPVNIEVFYREVYKKL